MQGYKVHALGMLAFLIHPNSALKMQESAQDEMAAQSVLLGKDLVLSMLTSVSSFPSSLPPWLKCWAELSRDKRCPVFATYDESRS